MRPLMTSAPLRRLGRGRAGMALLAISIFVLLLQMYSRQQREPSIYHETEGHTSPWRKWNETNPKMTEEARYLSYLAHTYRLAEQIPWYARRVKATYTAPTRPSIDEVPGKLMPRGFKKQNVEALGLDPRVDRSTLSLTLPQSMRPNQVDASKFIFAISTTLTRLNYAGGSIMDDWARWLTNGEGKSNGAGLVLLIQKASDEAEVRRIQQTLTSKGIDAKVLAAPKDMLDAPSRYAYLLEKIMDMGKQREGDKKPSYYGLVDDDIFFPSMPTLVAKLNSFFKPEEEVYVGLPSDRENDWVVEDGHSVTFGGGAIFVSESMATKMRGLPCWTVTKPDDFGTDLAREQAERERQQQQWDEQLFRCLTRDRSIRLHVLPSLYRPGDDPANLPAAAIASIHDYGGGQHAALALHHYRTWHKFNAGRGHVVTSVCGEDCFLQRFLFRDNWVLVNGHSLTHADAGVAALPLIDDKGVWRVQQGEGEAPPEAPPTNELLMVDESERLAHHDVKVLSWKSKRQTWRLMDSHVSESGDIWQAYIRRRQSGYGSGEVNLEMPGDNLSSDEEAAKEDSVIVLMWEK